MKTRDDILKLDEDLENNGNGTVGSKIWKPSTPRPSEITTLINMELLEKAQKMIFKMLQEHSFSREISSLNSNTIIHR